ncbi:MAG: hypothetical protein HOM14_00670 [Gammaproteobacteria bacterium]|jgi:hypothetical protein|nr:hypothetical protein [Gammaproteobacteria bacterium]MBT3722402.1 hypothetical protein [Gammaproteobacteria bacterium]MBT4075288.1 hypothetical protein [Gammaproteobacteria bacterium]MBT4196210.1 hypothetical protein [Gammaproteobacteria bacterium]MBT4861230.1 hypothetical protein [Gammaproteobacteria bacterium]
MEINTQVESYKFWDIVKLWGRETLEHDVIIARKLAQGVIKKGLRFQSTNPKWLNSTEELLSYPYIGYTSIATEGPIIVKAGVLAHLINVAEEKADPSELVLKDEVVLKNDFKKWLVRTGQAFPKFWYGSDE